MKRILKYIISTILLLESFGCRQELEDPHYSYTTIPITIDWSLSMLEYENIENISIYFFPEDGRSPYFTISGNIDSTSVSLPSGRYSVLIFNEVIGDISGINFGYKESYSEFYATAIVQSYNYDLFYEPESYDTLISTHEALAAWRQDDFVVVSDGICDYCSGRHLNDSDRESDKLTDITPTPVTALNTITVRIENLNNAMMIEGILKGSATAATLSTNARISSTEEISLYSCDFQIRRYDDTSNPVDGVTQSSVITFGKQPSTDATYQLVLNIVLNSGELTTYSYDVTDQVIDSDDFNIIIDLTDPDNTITLPESQSSGFGIDSWGESNDFNLM